MSTAATSSSLNGIMPASMRSSSSSSLMSVSRRAAFRLAISTYGSAVSGRTPARPLFIRRSDPSIPVSGERSSWAVMDANSVFCWLMRCASSCSRRVRAYACDVVKMA